MSTRPIRFVHRGARSTPASASCPRWTARRCSRWKTWPRGGGEALHPVQQAMVDCHGSQCGFCTPGFVMSLGPATSATRKPARSHRQQLADDLSGNLCRCTGYRPILDAGQRMFELPAAARLAGPPAGGARCASCAPIRPLAYAATRPGRRRRAARFHGRAAWPRWRAAQAAGAAAGRQHRHRPVGEQAVPRPGRHDLPGRGGRAARITVADGALHIGAAASLEDAWAALAAHWPQLREAWLRFASPPVRHAGTMGGNVANGSPIGDSAPVLIALGASMLLRRGERSAHDAAEDFYLDYMKNRLEPGEFVQAIVVPLPAPGQQLRAYKISKRYDCDISALCAGPVAAARRRHRAPTRASPSAAWRPSSSARPAPKPRCAASPGTRPRCTPRAGAGADFSR
jgi:xanthine dehydrogenase small subunit